MLKAKGITEATAKQRAGIEAGVRCGVGRGRGAEAVEVVVTEGHPEPTIVIANVGC